MDGIVIDPVVSGHLARRALRVAATAGLLVVFGYCAATAWDVLRALARVSLADVAQALRVVSVREAILCLVGYRVGRELLAALVQRHGGR
jgi:hypothetical protein